MTRSRDDSLVQRILAGALRTRIFWILWLVPWAIGAARRIGDQGSSVYQPYPLFDASCAGVYGGFAAVLGVFWLVWTVAAARTMRGPTGTTGILFDSGLLAVHFLFFWFFFVLGFDSLNALLDFSPKRDVPVLVQATHEVSWRDKTGGRSSRTVATVNRVERPDEKIEIGWSGCKLPAKVIPSPFVTLRVGRGAFRFPWLGEPLCHAMKADDLPLFQDVFLGRGRPAVLVTLRSYDWTNSFRRFATRLADDLSELRIARDTFAVEALLKKIDSDAGQIYSAEDRKHLLDLLRPAVDAERAPKDAVDRALAFVHSTDELSQPEYTAPRWLASIERAWPGVTVLWINDGEAPAWAKSLDCAGCRSIGASDLDKQIAATFFESEAPGKASQIYLADRTGKRVFSSALSDLGRRDELAKQLAALRAP